MISWFRRYVGRCVTQRIKKYFSSFRDFPGKIGSVMLWDNIKMDLREVGCDPGEWIDLAEDRDHGELM